MSKRMMYGLAVALAALLGTITGASAQYGRPYQPYQQYNRGQPEPGRFDYYLLSLSWSPTFCAEQGGRGGNDDQCSPRARPYAFVLHGLWPQHERGWPEDCRSRDNGFVPRPVARRMLDIMPSERLVFHEYRKHGTCSGLGVDGYFDLARKLYEKVQIPRRFVGLTDERMFVSPGDVVHEFVHANPGLKPDMMAIACGGAGNRLKEVRICFDRDGNFRACGANESQRRLCQADRMYVPPLRLGAGGQNQQPQRPQQREQPKQDEPEGDPDEIAPGPRTRRL